MILESELLHETLHVGDHLVERLVGIFRLLDSDDLDLVELMQAVESAHVLAVGSGLAAEAGSIGGQLLRKLVVIQNHVAEDVGDRHLSGGHEVEIVETDIVHLRLLVRELAGAETGSGVHHHGGLGLLISGLGILVEEEVDESPLQTCALSFIYREACAGDLHAEVEVDDVVFLCKFPVRKRAFGEFDLGAAFLDNQIVGCVLSFGDETARGVRQEHELILKFGCHLFALCEELRALLLESSHCSFGSLCGILETLFHEAADFGSLLFLLGEESIALHLEGAALLVEFEHFFDYGSCVEIFNPQAVDNCLRVIT